MGSRGAFGVAHSFFVAVVVLWLSWAAMGCEGEKRAPFFIPGDHRQVDGGSIGTTSGAATSATDGPSGHDCEQDDDCPGSRCVEVRPEGFRTCERVIPEHTSCESDLDECCSTDDCPEGRRCYHLRDLPWRRRGEPLRAICVGDLCDDDGDCLNNTKCIAEHTIGWPNRQCISMLCETDEDCDPGGTCAPVENECLGRVGSFDCVYASGCRSNSDCGDDQPPFVAGETYCAWGECWEVLQGVLCGGG